MNKYVNIVDIKTKRIDDMSDEDISSFCAFIKEYYLRTKHAEYLPEEHHIMEYMKGTSHPSYTSVYYRPSIYSRDTSTSYTKTEINKDTDIYSVISARILHITLKNIATFPLYYIDNLCVNSAMRKKGIAPKAIQTLHYDLRRKNEKVRTFLFKREGEMTAIIPLTTFITYGYNAKSIECVELPHARMSMLEVTTKNLSLFVDLLQNQRDLYECIIVPDITNIANMVKNDVISIRGIIENGNLIAIYIFRDAATQYDGERALELVCSICACHFNEIYYAGFTLALDSCSKHWKSTKIIIDGVGNNEKLINFLEERSITHFLSSPSAYFLYNYVSYACRPDKCFIFS